MDWIYISPHLDDVALSCGGLVWEQAQTGQDISVWTICAGDPPPGKLSPFAKSLHDRWGTGKEAMEKRRQEDARSCSIMGASYRHLNIPDCIYRRGGPQNQPLYASEESLFGQIHPQEAPLVERLRRTLEREIPSGVQVVCPLSLGGHVDHLLARAAVERMLFSRLEVEKPILWYYQDYPYTQQKGEWLDPRREGGWESVTFPITRQGFRAWGDAVAAHFSQISTFWQDQESMREALREYAHREGGVRLWRCD